MARVLLGKIQRNDPGVDHFSQGFDPVYGDDSVSVEADPWIYRDGDAWVTCMTAAGRLSEVYSYKFVSESPPALPGVELYTWEHDLHSAMFEAHDPGPVLFEKRSEAHSDSGYFSAWTERRVYFPVKYDGGVWICSAPRNPTDERLYPVGGG